MSEYVYTPTADEVRDAASEDGATAIEVDAFDRWLATVKAAAWDEGQAAQPHEQAPEDFPWMTPELAATMRGGIWTNPTNPYRP